MAVSTVRLIEYHVQTIGAILPWSLCVGTAISAIGVTAQKACKDQFSPGHFEFRSISGDWWGSSPNRREDCR